MEHGQELSHIAEVGIVYTGSLIPLNMHSMDFYINIDLYWCQDASQDSVSHGNPKVNDTYTTFL